MAINEVINRTPSHAPKSELVSINVSKAAATQLSSKCIARELGVAFSFRALTQAWPRSKSKRPRALPPQESWHLTFLPSLQRLENLFVSNLSGRATKQPMTGFINVVAPFDPGMLLWGM